MRSDLLNYTVFPSVVKADEISKIRIKGNREYYGFFDDVKYFVYINPTEYHDVEINDEFTLDGYEKSVIELYPKNGVIEFEYKFIGEQAWRIVIKASPEQYNKLNNIHLGYEKYWNNRRMEDGVYFDIYSLNEDLYKRRPKKGDFHLHSVFSDGSENPEIVASNMRRYGNDFCTITDHRNYTASVRAKEKFDELNCEFKVYYGEEVHENFDGRIHIVNFNGNSSVNEYIMNNYDSFMSDVKEEAKKINNLCEKEALQTAFYKVIKDEINKRNGMAIMAHPFWFVFDAYNCPTNVTREVFKRGYFDAFEIMGGIEVNRNNLQSAMYNEMRAEGIKIPIVASTDCHNTHNRGMEFAGDAYTIVFSNGDIIESVKDLYSVGVEAKKGEFERAYGPFRLVKYALFLIENYYPIHNRLSESSGVMMCEYFNGAKNLKPAIEEMEKQIKEFENNFFEEL